MKPINVSLLFVLLIIMFSCKRLTKNDKRKNADTLETEMPHEKDSTPSNAEKANRTQPGETENITSPRSNKGIGPINEVTLKPKIDEEMADKGEKHFNNECASCHRINESSMGPALGNVLERRSPEFVMNMILNTEEMIDKDPVIKSLRAEYESEMVQTDVTEEEARQIVEYLRNYQ